ncbi:MAG: TolB family protein, partial [Solirubrobacterales bacterium]
MRLRLLTVLALALAAAAPPAHATYAGGNGRIAFEDAGVAIATVNADGSDYQVLATGREPAWSPTGDRLAFRTPANAIAVVNADGTGRRTVAQRNWAANPTWSPDGERLALGWDSGPGECRFLVITRVDGTESKRVPLPPELCRFDDLEWSPTGSTIAFSARRLNPDFSLSSAEIFTVQDDGADLTQVTNEADPATDPEWSPDGSRILYDVAPDPVFGTQNVVSIKPDGTDRTVIAQGRDPVWSPDSSEIAFIVFHGSTGSQRIEVQRTNHSSSRSIMQLSLSKDNLDWQRLTPGPPGYPRPKAASPVRVALVPTYYPCLEPNREHGPPLSFPSCNPPVQGSNYLTVGTADANGNQPRFVGELRYDVVVGNPGTSADEADVQLTASLSDIRCRVAGPACT